MYNGYYKYKGEEMKDKERVSQDQTKLHNLLNDTEITFRLYNKDGSKSKLKLSWSNYTISQKQNPKPKANPDYYDYLDLEFVLSKE